MWKLVREFLILFDFLISFSLIYKYSNLYDVFTYNINLYLLIIKVLIISTSLAGTEVRFTRIKFMFMSSTIIPEVWVFFNSSYTCWTWYTFPLITKLTQVIADSQWIVFPPFCKDFYNFWIYITSTCRFVPVHLVWNVFYSPHTKFQQNGYSIWHSQQLETNAAIKTSFGFSALTFFHFHFSLFYSLIIFFQLSDLGRILFLTLCR